MVSEKAFEFPERLQASISERLAALNFEVGRTVDWYSDEAENRLMSSLEERLDNARAAASGVDGLEQRMGGALRQQPHSPQERLTPWEFRRSRQRYNSHVAGFAAFLNDHGVEVPPCIIVEGPTGLVNAQVVRDEESGICVAYVEEGLLNFGFSMMQLLISSLPLPAQVNGGLELRFGRSAGEPVYSKDQRILRLFEIACQYLLGSASGRLQPFPLQPIQYAAAAPLWDCIEAFVVGHEFSHALHADLSAAAPTLTEPDVEAEAALAIASVMADPIQQHAAMPHLLDLLRELQADFRAVDLMLGTRAHSTGAVMALTAPLVFLECLEILEELLFRLAYGRDATGPGFTGHPSPRMRKAYLLSRLQKYADTELLTEVSSLFKDIQQVLADIWPMVAEQMHILGRHEVEPNTKWRRMVRSMAPIEEGS